MVNDSERLISEAFQRTTDQALTSAANMARTFADKIEASGAKISAVEALRFHADAIDKALARTNGGLTNAAE